MTSAVQEFCVCIFFSAFHRCISPNYLEFELKLFVVTQHYLLFEADGMTLLSLNLVVLSFLMFMVLCLVQIQSGERHQHGMQDWLS